MLALILVLFQMAFDHDRTSLWLIISLFLFFDLLFVLYLQILDSLCEFVDLNLSFHDLLAFFNSVI